MKRITLLILLSFFFITHSAIAQFFNTGNMYTQNQFVFNPASAGDKGKGAGYFGHRYRWYGLEGAPKTMFLGVHTPIGEKMGLGGSITNDTRGVLSAFTTNLAYSYKVNLADIHTLMFGASLGFMKNILEVSEVQVTDQANDPTLYDNYFEGVFFSAGAGIKYDWNQQLEVSIAAPRLVAGENQNRHIAGMVAYNLYFQDKVFELEPSVMLQSVKGSPLQYDINVYFGYKKNAWTQVTYRSNQTIVLALGLGVSKFNVGYAYEINNGTLSHISKGTHEIVISFL